MKTLERLPKEGSKIKYLGGYDPEICEMIVGDIYTIGKAYTDKGLETACVEIKTVFSNNYVSKQNWYIKGTGHGESNDFDKFEVVEEYLSREDLIKLNEEKNETIDYLKSALKSISLSSAQMIEHHIEESEVARILHITEVALDTYNK